MYLLITAIALLYILAGEGTFLLLVWLNKKNLGINIEPSLEVSYLITMCAWSIILFIQLIYVPYQLMLRYHNKE